VGFLCLTVRSANIKIIIMMSKTKTKQINYKEQYGVIVICKTEQDQINMYNQLNKQGLTLKIVTV